MPFLFLEFFNPEGTTDLSGPCLDSCVCGHQKSGGYGIFTGRRVSPKMKLRWSQDRPKMKPKWFQMPSRWMMTYDDDL